MKTKKQKSNRAHLGNYRIEEIDDNIWIIKIYIALGAAYCFAMYLWGENIYCFSIMKVMPFFKNMFLVVGIIVLGFLAWIVYSDVSDWLHRYRSVKK